MVCGYTRNVASQILTETQTNDTYSWDGFVAKSLAYTAKGQNDYTAVGGSAYCHGAKDNLTADGQYVYLYDGENRMVEMRVAANANCAGLFAE